MKLLKTTAIGIVAVLLTASLSACTAKADKLELNISNIPDYFKAVYYTKIMEKDKVAAEYDNNYLLEKTTVNGQKCFVLSTSAIAPTKENNGEQMLVTNSRLSAENGTGYTVLMPLEIDQSYEDSAKPKNNTYIKAVHDQSSKISALTIKQFKKETDEQLSDKTYNIKLADQYFDEDSLLLALAAMPLKQGFAANIMLSASNRDRLQSMKIEVLADENITVPAGSFDCYSVRIRANTIFTNYATFMYFSKENNMLIKIQQSNTSLELKEYSTEKPKE